MKNWFSRNLTNIISLAFVIPILLVAFVSISHVTSFYGLSNPFTWAIYLSVGIEIAALSALAAVSVNMGRFVYFPFLIVTFIQMLGNIFFSFTYIDETSQTFQDWISMVGGLFENMGIETTDLNTHKTVLAFLTGGLLPVISLTFAHMLVKFTEKNKEVVENIPVREEIKIVFDETKKTEEPKKWEPSEEQLSELEEILKNNYPKQSEVKHKPYQPTDEDLRKIEEVLTGYSELVKENINNDNDVIEEPIEEIVEQQVITEDNQYNNTVYMGLLKKEDDVQPEEVEKKNDIQTESVQDYKVLNYLKRDA
jgi:ABC-type multidrug transport system fused ATPase/permease subunit